MSEYIKNKSQTLRAEHLFSKKRHYFNVKSGDEEYKVSVQVNCDCKFMSVVGQANGKICSHILAALQEIVDTGGHLQKEKAPEPKLKIKFSGINLV